MPGRLVRVRVRVRLRLRLRLRLWLWLRLRDRVVPVAQVDRHLEQLRSGGLGPGRGE
tara:strand:- start:52 stop:222 length:171 start_codon:yes stop_codon:yes gene_type:complete